MAKLRPAVLLLLFKILPNRHLKASKNDKLDKKYFKKFCFTEIVIIKSVYSNSVALNENSNFKFGPQSKKSGHPC